MRLKDYACQKLQVLMAVRGRYILASGFIGGANVTSQLLDSIPICVKEHKFLLIFDLDLDKWRQILC